MMKQRLTGLPSTILAVLVAGSFAVSDARAQNTIVYGNGNYGIAPSSNYDATPYVPQQYPEQNGYSRVTPQRRVMSYDRVTPQAYRGVGQGAPSIRYNTQQNGYYYGSEPAYGYGLSYGSQVTSGYASPRSMRPSSRNRVFPGR